MATATVSKKIRIETAGKLPPKAATAGRFGAYGGRYVPETLMFALSHNEWLAAILCAFVYQGLVCWKGRLGDAVAAHGITNFLLGAYVVWKGAWHFW